MPCCTSQGEKITGSTAEFSAHHHLEATNITTRPQENDAQCCEDQSCKCDDICLEQLARAICADDAAHLHGGGDDAKGVDIDVLSDCSTCVNDGVATIATLTTRTCSHIGLRKRNIAHAGDSQGSPLPSEACGQHMSYAHSRYQQTLAAFGCICRAMLAHGLQSCCTTKDARKVRTSLRSARSSASFIRLCTKPRSITDSCCEGSSCRGKRDPSTRVASHPVGTCCNDDKPSCSSGDKDPCCNGITGSYCGSRSQSPAQYSHEDTGAKSNVHEDAFEAGILEKGLGTPNEHAVLAIQGMTCTGCENKIIRVLKALPLVANVKTSLVLCRAEFDFDSSAADLQTLVQEIEKRTGFSVEVIGAGTMRELRLRVERNKHDAFLATHLPDGVVKAFSADRDIICIVYDPRAIGAREVILTVAAFSPILAPEPREPAIAAGLKHIRHLTLRTASSAILTVPVLVMAWAPLPSHARAYTIASLVFATLVQTLICGPIYLSAFKSLFFVRAVEIDLLIVLSTTAAYVYSVVACAFSLAGRPLATGGFFETSTLLVTLIVLGQLVSAYACQRAMETISIRSMQHTTAKLVRSDGSEEDIDARLLQYGDIFKVEPDSAVITDGIVYAGQSEVNESMMTGESKPVVKVVGSTVIAGAVNGPSTLLVTATRLPGENTISEIAEMVDDARVSRANVQATVDRVVGWFIPVLIGIAVITFVAWVVVGCTVQKRTSNDAVATALTYAIAVLAVSCPCAIGLAVPMVILIAGGVAAKHGMVFKDAAAIEIARKITHVVFDKTGTLTQGELSVVCADVSQLPAFDVNAAIAELVKDSRHPVARAVGEYLKMHGDVGKTELDRVELVTGNGIQSSIAGGVLCGGNPRWLNEEDHPMVRPMLQKGHTTFCVTHDSRLIAAFGLEDDLRPESRAVVEAFRKRNVRVSILSGDHYSAVENIASLLGISKDNIKASCLPVDKQTYVATLSARGERVLFCGDGTNDAVALASADIGVHLHTGEGAGFAASSAANVVLLNPALTGLLTLMELSEAIARRIRLNFVWSAVYNLVAVLFAAGAFVNIRLPPMYAGLGEIVSVLPVMLVALQLRWFKSSH